MFQAEVLVVDYRTFISASISVTEKPIADWIAAPPVVQRTRATTTSIVVIMPGIACSNADCQYNTDSQIPDTSSLSDKLQCLQLHTQAVHQVAKGGQDVRSKAEKLPRPVIKMGIGMDEFQFFQSVWAAYKRSSKLTDSSAT